MALLRILISLLCAELCHDIDFFPLVLRFDANLRASFITRGVSRYRNDCRITACLANGLPFAAGKDICHLAFAVTSPDGRSLIRSPALFIIQSIIWSLQGNLLLQFLTNSHVLYSPQMVILFLTFVLSFLLQLFLAYAQVPANQAMPQTPIAPGTFSNGAPQLVAEPPNTGDVPDPMYAARPVDLPFFRLYNGTLKFFSAGELNTPDQDTDAWGSEYDNANQSACGIPDNAFSISKVAIHPYFLKYASLSREYRRIVTLHEEEKLT